MESNPTPPPPPTPPEPPRTAASDVVGGQFTGAFEQMSDLMGNFARVATAAACIGPAQTSGGHTIVPVASVSLQAGFGLGFGGGGGGEGTASGQGSGGGGGGGGQASARVVAVVDVSDGGVSVRPVIDLNRIILTLLVFAGLKLLAGHDVRLLGRRLFRSLASG